MISNTHVYRPSLLRTLNHCFISRIYLHYQSVTCLVKETELIIHGFLTNISFFFLSCSSETELGSHIMFQGNTKKGKEKKKKAYAGSSENPQPSVNCLKNKSKLQPRKCMTDDIKISIGQFSRSSSQ